MAARPIGGTGPTRTGTKVGPERRREGRQAEPWHRATAARSRGRTGQAEGSDFHTLHTAGRTLSPPPYSYTGAHR